MRDRGCLAFAKEVWHVRIGASALHNWWRGCGGSCPRLTLFGRASANLGGRQLSIDSGWRYSILGGNGAGGEFEGGRV